MSDRAILGDYAPQWEHVKRHYKAMRAYRRGQVLKVIDAALVLAFTGAGFWYFLQSIGVV